MTALTEETALKLIASLEELTFVMKGLTGVLIDAQEGDDQDEEEQGAGVEQTDRYMDGSTVGG